MPATCPESCPQPKGVCRAEAESAGMIVMELLERLPFGRIEISVANGKIMSIEHTERHRLKELEATFAAELG
jgi:hypothetical protein